MPKINKKFILIIIAIIAIIGAILLVFTKAAPNNCQQENGASICDVDAVWGVSDTVMGTGTQAQDLGNQGWGWYMGAVFRAPTTAYQGAIPVHAVSNAQYSWREYVTDAQKRDKEAKYGPNTYEGVAFFAWDHPVANTVPVYRLTQGGSTTKSVFTTDKAWADKMVAEGGSNPDAWKMGTVLPAIAFYAYPPNYMVADQPNPYDCSITENLVTDRCKDARENLAKAVASGAIPATNDCPKTLEIYHKAPFPGQFSADCQKFWNTYMQDCRVIENFTSDRCKAEREALAKAQEEQAKARAQAQAELKRTQAKVTAAGGKGGGSGTNSPTASTSQRNCSSPNQTADEKKFCKAVWDNEVAKQKRLAAEKNAYSYTPGLNELAASFGANYFGTPSSGTNYTKIVKGDCRVVLIPVIQGNAGPYTAISKTVDWLFGNDGREKLTLTFKNVTGEECVKKQKHEESKGLFSEVQAYLENQRYVYVKK